MTKFATRHFPIYFTHTIRKEVGQLYAAASIADLATALILFFEPIYFVTVLGWSLTKVLLFFAAVYFFYIVLIPLGGKISAGRGYGFSLALSVPFQIGYWLLLFYLPQAPSLAVLAALFFALQKTFFWPAFHADLARFSDSDQRARESSVAWSLAQLTFIVGPFLGGLIAHRFGIPAVLIVASAVYFLMFIPVLSGRRHPERNTYRFRDSLAYYRRFPKEALLYSGFGEELVVLVVWPVFIFTIIPHFFNLGSLIAIATLLATVIMLYAGKLGDKGEGRSVLHLGVIFSLVVWLSRPLIGSLISVFTADTLLRIGRNLFYVPVTTYIYNRANQEKILAYVIFFEQSLSIAKLAASLLGAAVFALTQSFGLLFLLSAVFTTFYFVLPRKGKKLFSGNILK